MTDIIALVASVMSMTIATIGATAVSLGLVAAGSLVFGLAVSVFRRVKGR